MRGGGGVPRVCFQTSKEPIKPYIVEQLKQNLHGWEYRHFTDDQIMEFFRNERHPKYSEEALVAKFNSFTYGEHKADLFRYYYLLMKGGVFIDSDLLISIPLTEIIGNNHFVSVRALQPVGSVFNGFLAATPDHPIIQDAMEDIMKVENETLKGFYHLLVARLGTFVDKHMGPGIMLLKEISNDNKSCNIADSSGKIVMVHYQNMEPPVQAPVPESS
jgi:mannosyltransferase OCH1-like enzyme